MITWNKIAVPLDVHLQALKAAEQKALQIKDRADTSALELARTIQTYKDEKANELREQIGSERNLYVTKAELKPIYDYVAAQQGSSRGATNTIAYIVLAISVAISIASFLIK